MGVTRLPLVALLLNLVVVSRGTPLVVLLLFQLVQDRNVVRSTVMQQDIADALTIPIQSSPL